MTTQQQIIEKQAEIYRLARKQAEHASRAQQAENEMKLALVRAQGLDLQRQEAEQALAGLESQAQREAQDRMAAKEKRKSGKAQTPNPD